MAILARPVRRDQRRIAPDTFGSLPLGVHWNP